MPEISKKIMNRVRRKGRGRWVCTSHDFLDLGNRATVGRALARLAKKGELRRIGRGLYDFPRFSAFFNDWAPTSVECGVDAIVRRDGIKIMRGGGDCANGLGLTVQVPAQYYYTTDGATRVVKVDGVSVYFWHADPTVMSWAGRPSAAVAQAIRWIREPGSKDPSIVRILRRNLSEAVKKDFFDNKENLPDWALHIADQLVEPDEAYAKRPQWPEDEEDWPR